MGNKKEGKVKVLIVDDEKEMRICLRLTLEKRNFIVEEAGNGREALEKISRSKPDIILLDGLMPVMDGFETCRYLRENSETKNIPIIFCTAVHIVEIRSGKLKIDDYIEKPFFINELLDKIDRVLQKKK